MNRKDPPYDLIVAGGGPAGMLAALLAARAGLRTVVLEKRTERIRHSRSIGIHPPSMAILEQVGLLDRFLEQGTIIRRGMACARYGQQLGVINFGSLDLPFGHLLTIPQWQTEQFLEQELDRFNPDILQKGRQVTGFDATSYEPSPAGQDSQRTPADSTGIQTSAGPTGVKTTADPVSVQTPTNPSTVPPSAGPVSVQTITHDDHKQVWRGRYLIACDGKHSRLRTAWHIGFPGGPYPWRYAMGDFPDQTGFGSDGIIFLTREGLIECFPLPGGLRRWVIQQPRNIPASDPAAFADIIRDRCGISPDPQTCRMFSDFAVEHYLADTFWKGPVILAGDAAHVVSPIGGQGMNLGWMNVSLAVSLIRESIEGTLSTGQAARTYERVARKRARKVIRRAEQNMFLGNRSAVPKIRNHLVKHLLASRVNYYLGRRFAMQGL